jgi:hypothetical protein
VIVFTVSTPPGAIFTSKSTNVPVRSVSAALLAMLVPLNLTSTRPEDVARRCY